MFGFEVGSIKSKSSGSISVQHEKFGFNYYLSFSNDQTRTLNLTSSVELDSNGSFDHYSLSFNQSPEFLGLKDHAH